jgi:endonuclease I
MYFYFAVMKIQLLAIIMLCLIILLIRFYHSLLNQLLACIIKTHVTKRNSANNAIYARQNNRNPFIDNPQYVNAIWKIEAVWEALLLQQV